LYFVGKAKEGICRLGASYSSSSIYITLEKLKEMRRKKKLFGILFIKNSNILFPQVQQL